MRRLVQAVLATCALCPLSAQTIEPSFAIEVRVLDAASQKPIAGARVHLQRLTGRAGQQSATASTATDLGVVVFDSLAPGEYRVVATKEGYRRRGTTETSVVTVDGSKPRANVELTLARGAAITGRITDRERRPLTGVAVAAWSKTYRFGNPVYVEAAAGKTNTEGYYEFQGIPPGTYAVGTREARRGLERGRPTGDEQREMPAFYPNSDSLTQASTITVAGSETKEGIDITVSRGRRYCAEAVAAGGENTDELSISVFRRWGEATPSLGDTVAYGRVAPGERFFACSLAPGRYEIWAKRNSPGKEEGRFARREVWIAKGDANAGVLEPQPPVALRIEVAMTGEGELRPTAGVAVLLPEGRPAIAGEQLQARLGDASAGLRAFPDEFRLLVAGTPPDVFLKSAELDNRQVPDGTFRAAGGVLRLRLSREAARVLGSVTKGASDRVLEGVVAMARDPIRQDGSDTVVRPIGPDGSFAFDGLPPGTYRAVALAGPTRPEAWAPELIAQGLSDGQRLDLSPRRILVIELPQKKIP